MKKIYIIIFMILIFAIQVAILKMTMINNREIKGLSNTITSINDTLLQWELID